jgi:hypothetical protein
MTLHRDERDFFAPPIAQPTFYGEDVCRPGWVQSLPLPASAPLYTPNVTDAPDYTNADADPDDLFGPEPPLRFRPVTAEPAQLVFDEGGEA